MSRGGDAPGSLGRPHVDAVIDEAIAGSMAELVGMGIDFELGQLARRFDDVLERADRPCRKPHPAGT